MPRKKKNQELEISAPTGLTDLKSKFCSNQELSNRFIDDTLRVLGYETDDNGYVIDAEDMYDEKIICVKDKKLRIPKGIYHDTDMIFDPYNNNIIMANLFNMYLTQNRQDVSSSTIFITEKKLKYKSDVNGFISILFSNGDTITTNQHIKDSTKYLEALMRLESMTDVIIKPILQPYDDFEKIVYEQTLKEL